MGRDPRRPRCVAPISLSYVYSRSILASVDPAANPGNIDDIPDLDGPSSLSNDLDSLTIGGDGSKQEGEVPTDIPDMDDIPDMEEEGLEGADDEATAKPAVITMA